MLALDLGQRGLGLEMSHRHKRAAHVQNACERLREGGMEHGQRPPHHVARAQPKPVYAADNAGVLQHDVVERAPLRHGRGAGGVEHRRDVLGSDRRAARVNLALRHGLGQCPKGGAIEETGACVVSQTDSRTQIWGVTDAGEPCARGRRRQPGQRLGQQGGIVRVLGRQVAGHDDADAGIGGDVRDLARLEAGVVEHGHGADQCRPEQRLDEFDAVRHQDAHAISVRHPKRKQRARALSRALRQLGIRGPSGGQHDAVAVEVAQRTTQQQQGQISGR